MRLALDSVVPFLAARGLLDLAEVVEGDIVVVDSSRRNTNFRVQRSGRASYFLKTVADGGTEAERTLRSEALFYAYCSVSERAADVRPYLPVLHSHSSDDHLLLLELLDAAPLSQLYASQEPARLPVEVGHLLGVALARCHLAFRATHSAFDPQLAGFLPCAPPWILWAHKPGPDVLTHLSSGNLQTLKILQREESLSLHLDSLRSDWAPDTLVHGDIKADNLLLSREQQPRLFIVDWELVHLGDPAWDVGSALQDFLRLWISSMPLGRELTPEQMAAKSRYSIQLLRSACRGLWHSYRTTAALERDDGRFLLRAVRFCAARLVQTAFEHAQGASVLGNDSVMMLQVAANIFANPTSATRQLFELPVTE